MPCPTLYHTSEEKAAARRATSKKYYEKHRVQINRRSRRKYKKKLQNIRKDTSRKGKIPRFSHT
ncbi:uncharacterized protein LACBIDRAFT_311919 [Laccaria bicolor S238N-H82]|uniref:Predicted protein n=1 Tax=Laccaria bicolor (strain S238N-H82 / ATCC MYA-4686) TaxID=486041 RepID=B0CYM1_LACBS|nr:uncharacterized protein LACBIDRAFT_311919 [Laccaria bicolor S238N-H82]EDR12474.1 predicted protein [Laccaria bicolor S238N-H82]|eukprot:XP_001876738.1 predicted protein [Laccaria bicolor S238N-H82]